MKNLLAFATTALFTAGVFIAISLVALVVCPFFHESGHALACYAQGYSVMHFSPFGFHPSTDCTENNTWISAAAGTAASVTMWFVITAILNHWLLLRYRGNLAWLSLFSAVWFAWSYIFLGEVLNWAWLVHSTRNPPPDTARFATVTHIRPQWIIGGAWTLAAIVVASAAPLVWKIIWAFFAFLPSSQLQNAESN